MDLEGVLFKFYVFQIPQTLYIYIKIVITCTMPVFQYILI